ncbi:helix-turn-helix domain-containing protein [Mesorhizobium sp. YC-39]|uniref:helix-turn-helix domain-containing protein n=1 Tax=unclassified Mesorhizobium TaxID=325217 RepID=UPI0021E96B75|nr:MULTISPECIES: helix-turn-helix domain-containing protein [unclassified Mesorhizobium]MCV3205716.1 helix-turn-helix domain-containing protein [Mesorhizobium sp. YC-2]MCV3227885.1 helix-turn-helix domain-containing protein [Mesorhizobium sp. YC-39]
MSSPLFTVEQVAEQLVLHPKTVLRYIRDGRLQATRIGKSYRIARAELDAFAGTESGHSSEVKDVRTTCIVDIPHTSPERAERTAAFLNSAAMAGGTAPLHINTAFDPLAKTLKVVLIGSPSDTAKLLEMLQLQLGGRS